MTGGIAPGGHGPLMALVSLSLCVSLLSSCCQDTVEQLQHQVGIRGCVFVQMCMCVYVCVAVSELRSHRMTSGHCRVRLSPAGNTSCWWEDGRKPHSVGGKPSKWVCDGPESRVAGQGGQALQGSVGDLGHSKCHGKPRQGFKQEVM